MKWEAQTDLWSAASSVPSTANLGLVDPSEGVASSVMACTAGIDLVIGDPDGLHEPAHGSIAWAKLRGDGRLVLAWDWAEARPNVCALINPVTPGSNARLVRSDRVALGMVLILLELNAIVHFPLGPAPWRLSSFRH